MSKFDEREVYDKEICPCGSGDVYKKCCKKKKFKWIVENGNFYKRVKMDKELTKVLKEYMKWCENMYGRKLQDDDRMFWGYLPSEFGINEIRAMRKMQIPERQIFAYYETGRILTPQGTSKIPDIEIQEFYDSLEKYDRLMDPTNGPSSVFYTSKINAILKEDFMRYYEQLTFSFSYFIRKHIENVQDFLNYSVKNEIDFCGFCCIKSIRNLDSTKVLVENGLTENIYATNRFIFESYLYVLSLNEKPSFFDEKIKPKVNEDDYSFSITKDGKINYNQVIHNETNEKFNLKISIKDLAYNSQFKEDRELYNLFYHYSSQFVHVDVLSAQGYFYESDPFQVIDESLIAALIGITFSILLLDQISIMSDTIFRKDIDYFVKRTKAELIPLYGLINGHPINKNEIFSVIMNRLQA